ncbi:MAG: arylsulfatase [Kiritimatiellae bacterium]|nr:arylsulfatase [Kiritimatiellia bacterium]
MKSAGILGALLAALGAIAAPRPNVVIILTDDLGYGDLGCHGNPMIRTPNLDRLHAESVRFTDFHVDPTCSPTRAALMTGRYSTRVGVWHTVMGRSLMFRDETTIAEVFAAHGYRTACIGKWHLGDNYPMRPQDRGFHETLIHGGGGIGQTPDWWGNDYVDDHYLHNGEWRAFRGYCTDVFFDAAIAFIERHRDRPFFLYLAPNVPHSPYRAPEAYRRACADRGVPPPMDAFYGMIEHLDEAIGRLRERLRSLGVADNTILMFLSDNGTAAGMRHGSGRPGEWTGFNAGMRGQKGSAYEGGHRVPCFLHWPAGGLAGGRDVRQLAAHFDLLPTLVELCGLSWSSPRPLDGRSLVPLLRGREAEWPDRTLFVHVQREEIPPKWRASAVMTQRWRLVDGRELYDITADAAQQRDVAAQYPAVVDELRARYEAWWATLEPVFDRYACIVVGADTENPCRLTCMDWHAPSLDEVPWDQSQVARLPRANGWWMIEVARAGRYRVTLRHQPATAPRRLEARVARVRAGAIEASRQVPDGADAVAFELDLPAGQMRLQTWLEDPASGASRGAFFVDVERLNDGR